MPTLVANSQVSSSVCGMSLFSEGGMKHYLASVTTEELRPAATR
jgi:hypothetical protein